MPSSIKVGDVQTALRTRSHPTVTVFNRLEGRPRTVAFDRALRAEVRDPLWMLTRQWQMGEFRAADAGSPICARVMLETTQLTKYRPNGQSAEAFPGDIPFEAKVERRTLPLRLAKRPIGLDLRLTMGRYWLKLIEALPNDYANDFIAQYPVAKPDPSDALQADSCAHLEAWQYLEAAQGRAMDGGSLYLYLTGSAAAHAYDGMPQIATTDYTTLDDYAKRFIAWFGRVISLPLAASDDAWVPNRLEYQFAASAPLADGTEKVYAADEYCRGHLDWYSLDLDPSIKTLGDVPGAPAAAAAVATRTMLPAPVSFSGMPNTRWWTFEDSVTNFGDIDASTTDVGKLLVMEFALVYANDWFVIPYTLPGGSIANVRGLAVTNVFGERLWVTAAGAGEAADWQRWSLFATKVRGDAGAPADASLLLLPTVPNILEGAILEDVALIRDESANMVWGIENTVTLSTGEPKRGIEISREATAYYEKIVESGGAAGDVLPAPSAPIRFQLMTTVPENWIPFIPARVTTNENREVQLQRAAMPRIIANDPAALPPELRKVEPRTALLREGLDVDKPTIYLIYEETVPRSGTRVSQRYERARWVGGAPCTWLRVRRENGRGEGSSGLAFDRLEAAPSSNK